MVNGKVIAAIVISILILFGAYFFVSVRDAQQSGNMVKIIGTGSSVIEPNTIEITNEGFFPTILGVSVGDKVSFVNKDTEKHRLVTDKTSNFDSGELEPGESWSFIFNGAGTWDYYDNLDTNLKGTIIVE